MDVSLKHFTIWFTIVGHYELKQGMYTNIQMISSYAGYPHILDIYRSLLGIHTNILACNQWPCSCDELQKIFQILFHLSDALQNKARTSGFLVSADTAQLGAI